MVVTENKEKMSILGLLFSDYDFTSLFKIIDSFLFFSII